MTDERIDVLVVGAGPAGLTMAGDLAAGGLRCTVIDRRSQEANTTRAFGVHARTLEELDARGVADELIETGARVRELQLFGGIAIRLSDLPSRFPFLLITPQYNTERVLEKRAREAGAVFRSGVEATGLEQDAEGVTVEARRVDDGGVERFRATYVVGADGIRSVVRKAIGQPYPGKAVVRSIMLADVKLTESFEDVLTVNAANDAFAFIAPFGDGWYRFFGWNRLHQVPDDTPVDFHEVEEVARRALGTDLGMHDPRWLSRFHSDERQVPAYQVGRVFLVGDAAHCHSPAGGQGMNTGIQDSVNLAWKLVAVLRDGAPEELLASYQDERHPVGREVLLSSGALVRLATIRSTVARTASRALARTVVAIGPLGRRAAGLISGIGIEYARPGGDGPGAGHAAGHRAGHRHPDVLVDSGAPADRLYELLRGGRFVVLVDHAAPDHLGLAVADAMGDQTYGWPGRVVTATARELVAPIVLVRPDGYIAWTGDSLQALQATLPTWCGPANGSS